MHNVAREIEFVAAVRQGLAEADRGELIPIEESERELPTWVTDPFVREIAPPESSLLEVDQRREYVPDVPL